MHIKVAAIRLLRCVVSRRHIRPITGKHDVIKKPEVAYITCCNALFHLITVCSLCLLSTGVPNIILRGIYNWEIPSTFDVFLIYGQDTGWSKKTRPLYIFPNI